MKTLSVRTYVRFNWFPNIDLFKIARPKDINLNYAISDTEGVTDLFFYHKSSPINTLDKQVSSYQKAAVTEIKKVKTFTLNYILNKLNFDQQIDYMNLDVEGFEMKVLNGFNIQKYKRTSNLIIFYY